MPGVEDLVRKNSFVTQGLLSTSDPRSAFLFPESSIGGTSIPGDDQVFVFQYWPETIEDSYSPTYGDRQIPGGSHPLYQWTGGSGRDITFTATFTAEVDVGVTRGAFGTRNPAITELTPSARYTVDVRAALNRLRSLMLPDYNGTGSNINTLASPPKKFYLVLQGSRLGGNKDYILCILRSAPITYQASFPNGTPRMAEVSLTCTEIVQQTSTAGSSSIRFIGRGPFEKDGAFYSYRGTVDRF